MSFIGESFVKSSREKLVHTTPQKTSQVTSVDFIFRSMSVLVNLGHELIPQAPWYSLLRTDSEGVL